MFGTKEHLHGGPVRQRPGRDERTRVIRWIKNPEAHIQARQRVEEDTVNFTQAAARNREMKAHALWEQKTEQKIEAQKLSRTMDLVQARSDQVLVARRLRLAELLNDERAQHEKLLASMVVTDEQRRERLMQQARNLRAQREQERQRLAERRRDQLFREKSILVREAESHIKLLHVTDERQKQLEQRRLMKEQEEAEERYWAQQQAAAFEAQTERQRRDLEEQHRRQAANSESIAVQMQADAERKARQRQLEQQRDMQSVAEIQDEIRNEQAQQTARRLQQMELAAATRRDNEILEKKKLFLKQNAKAEEAAELAAILEQKAEEERRELERKQHIKEQARYQKMFVEAQMNAAKESENTMDQLWQDEADREWEKKEAVWRQDQAKRNAICDSVLDFRRKQVSQIRQKEVLDAALKREAILQERELNAQLAAEDTQLRQRQRADALEVQAFLRRQIAEKEMKKLKERDEKRNALTDAQMEEHVYREKINEELRKLDASKPAQFQSIQLGQSRRRGLATMWN